MHVAIIMDGNGRWANRRELPRSEGHRAGAIRVREITEECVRKNIGYLTLYCLSSENWKRPKEELGFLMMLLKAYIINERSTLMDNNIVLSIIGKRSELPDDVLAEMDKSVAMTQKNTGLNLCLAINYGARAEIVNAVQNIIKEKIPAGDIDEKCLSEHLYTAKMPDPDLLIRTAGELRLSNYLLWQLSYSEIWVTDVCWPDFDTKLFNEALDDFSKRQRRFGGL